MSKRKRPAFQFYYKDWQSSRRVRLMSLAERGLYLEMLGRQAEDGSVPDNPELVARLIGVEAADVRASWARVRPCFEINGNGELVNIVQQERLEEYAEVSDHMSVLGALGNEKRWGKRRAKRKK